MDMSDKLIYLNICDSCSDRIGVVKEVFKTGGCTCDICGFAFPCARDGDKSTVSRTPIHLIPEEGWHWIHKKIESEWETNAATDE